MSGNVVINAHGTDTHRAVSGRWYLMLGVFAVAISCRTTPATNGTARMPESVPSGAWRFAISSTTDSTVAFNAKDAAWLRAGMTGYAVDPARRDAFVANLAVLSAQRGEYTALVTGQVRPVDSTHVVVVVKPPVRFWRAAHFWTGLFTGAAAATGTALIAK